MSLDTKDIEQIERVIHKNGDDTAVSIARSFERLEERVDAMEARIYSRIADLESVTVLDRADIANKFDALDNRISGQVSEINGRLTELLQG
jgi:phage shock protein A